MKADDRKLQIFVFGASGHAKVIIDILTRQNMHEIRLVVDDDPAVVGRSILGHPVIGGREELLSAARLGTVSHGIVAIGNNTARETVVGVLRSAGLGFITAVHPSASIASGVTIGEGSAIMAGAVINADAEIGEHVIVNTSASVDHDSHLAAFVHIAPGARLCGNVSVGRGSFICAGAVIIPNRIVGSGTIVGAGATVLCDLGDNVTAVGTPARPMERS